MSHYRTRYILAFCTENSSWSSETYRITDLDVCNLNPDFVPKYQLLQTDICGGFKCMPLDQKPFLDGIWQREGEIWKLIMNAH